MYQKGQTPVAVIVIILIVTSVALLAYFSAKHNTNIYVASSSNTPQSNESTYSSFLQDASNSSSSGAKKVIKSLPVPKDNAWLKYSATCPALKNNIEIYYPTDWHPAEWNQLKEVDPTPNECQVIFGYPVKPVSYQESTPGEIAQMRVSTWTDNTIKTVPEFINKTYGANIGGSLLPATVTINNTEYTRHPVNEEKELFIAQKGNRFFVIEQVYGQTLYDIDPSGNTFSVIDSSGQVINNGFLKRLRII